jgi:outer membrane protein assembly factor BamB
VYCLTPDGKLKWRFETGDQVDSGPVLGKDGTLYVGSDDHRLTAFK